MKNFSKKAVFVALMCALSSVSAFASERKTTKQNKEIDNANLHTKSQIKKNIVFLDKKEYEDNELKKIFEQLAKIKYDNFDGTSYTDGILGHEVPLNPRFVRQRNKLKEINKSLLNSEKYKNPLLIYGNPKSWNFKRTTLNPSLDLEDKYGFKKLVKMTSSEYYTNFKNGKNIFLICLNKNEYVDGFVQFEYLDENKEEIKILMLANTPEKNGIGIMRQMMELLQKQCTYISLTPNDDNAAHFYKKFGFNKAGSMHMFWKKK